MEEARNVEASAITPQRAVPGALLASPSRADPMVRHEINVAGTKRVLECCAQYGVKKLVVLSSSYVYGALPENPYYMDEDTSLNVSRHYPDIRDLAEVDTLCTAFLWKYPEIATALLRPVNTLGYYVHSAIGRYLKLRYVPTVMGFNPMMQFIHEEDVADAIARTLETGVRRRWGRREMRLVVELRGGVGRDGRCRAAGLGDGRGCRAGRVAARLRPPGRALAGFRHASLRQCRTLLNVSSRLKIGRNPVAS